MKLYIPFALRNNGHAIYDVITSIVCAEGIAPTSVGAFNGVVAPRSSPLLFTGGHPLNPFKEHLLAFDKLPLLDSVRYVEEHENTAYVSIEEDAISAPEGCALVKSPLELAEGVTVYTTPQALFFTDPSKVSILFVSPKTFEKCRGCRTGVNAKNETAFGYRVLTDDELKNAFVVSTEMVTQLSAEGMFQSVRPDECVPSWRMESVQGASLCYSLVKQYDRAEEVSVIESDWKKVTSFTEWLERVPYRTERWSNWDGQKTLNRVYELLHTIPSLLQNTCASRFSRREDFGSCDSLHRQLIEHFVDIAVSLKNQSWNWADDECRAVLAETVMNECVIPVMRRNSGSDVANEKIDKMARLMSMVVRKFREPNTYVDFDEDKLNSDFVRAFYRFLGSAGRIDRIQECLTDSRLKAQTREMIAIMYGAFKGYAQVSVKRLMPVLPQSGIQDPVFQDHVLPRSTNEKPVRESDTLALKHLLDILRRILPKSKGKKLREMEDDIRTDYEAANGDVERFFSFLEKRVGGQGRRTWVEKYVKDMKKGFSEQTFCNMA